jgi:hypothetical protein
VGRDATATPPRPIGEVCDGLDDDRDGVVDEGVLELFSGAAERTNSSEVEPFADGSGGESGLTAEAGNGDNGDGSASDQGRLAPIRHPPWTRDGPSSAIDQRKQVNPE